MVSAAQEYGLGGIFPAIRSLLDPQALLAVVGADYPLDAPRTCTLLRASWNDTYLVRTATGKAILRVYGAVPVSPSQSGERPYPFNSAGHTLASIRYELALLAYLDGQGIGVAAPIARHDGEFLTPLRAVEGVRQLALFPYAPGEVTKPHPFGDAARSFRVPLPHADRCIIRLDIAVGTRVVAEP